MIVNTLKELHDLVTVEGVLVVKYDGGRFPLLNEDRLIVGWLGKLPLSEFTKYMEGLRHV